MLSYLLVIGAFLFLIVTSSVAQVRYAVTNIFASTSLMLNLAIAVLLIATGIYLKIHKDKKNDYFQLSGTKGGKSSKKKKDPAKVKSSYPNP